MSSETCPSCGAELPRNAKCCHECGADENTGWSESALTDGLGISDEKFDHEQFVSEEFGNGPKPHGISWFWWLTAIIVLALFLFLYLR